MTEGMNGMNCETPEPISCLNEAVSCATLTDSDGMVIAHKFLCEKHALSMFAVSVDIGKMKETRENHLNERIAKIVNAQQMDDRSENFGK